MSKTQHVLNTAYDLVAPVLAERFAELAQLGSEEIDTLVHLGKEVGLEIDSLPKLPSEVALKVKHTVFRPLARACVTTLFRAAMSPGDRLELDPESWVSLWHAYGDIDEFCGENHLDGPRALEALRSTASRLIESGIFDSPVQLTLQGRVASICRKGKSLRFAPVSTASGSKPAAKARQSLRSKTTDPTL